MSKITTFATAWNKTHGLKIYDKNIGKTGEHIRSTTDKFEKEKEQIAGGEVENKAALIARANVHQNTKKSVPSKSVASQHVKSVANQNIAKQKSPATVSPKAFTPSVASQTAHVPSQNKNISPELKKYAIQRTHNSFKNKLLTHYNTNLKGR